VWKAIKSARTKPGDWILISGAGGGLGHLAIQYARGLSLRIIAVDTGSDKEKLCRDLGAEVFLDFKASKDLIKDVKDAAGGSGPHVSRQRP
jgi:propanol-preferring alcohol dehydrogenase